MNRPKTLEEIKNYRLLSAKKRRHLSPSDQENILCASHIFVVISSLYRLCLYSSELYVNTDGQPGTADQLMVCLFKRRDLPLANKLKNVLGEALRPALQKANLVSVVILSESGAPFHEFIQSHMSVLKNIIMF
jgi:hypothetical protein